MRLVILTWAEYISVWANNQATRWNTRNKIAKSKWVKCKSWGRNVFRFSEYTATRTTWWSTTRSTAKNIHEMKEAKSVEQWRHATLNLPFGNDFRQPSALLVRAACDDLHQEFKCWLIVKYIFYTYTQFIVQPTRALQKGKKHSNLFASTGSWHGILYKYFSFPRQSQSCRIHALLLLTWIKISTLKVFQRSVGFVVYWGRQQENVN